MLESLGKIKNKIKSVKYKIDLREIKDGSTFKENFIIQKNFNSIKIYSRLCDHAGGKIISLNGASFCPVHNWKFDPVTGYYDNGIKKEEINYKIINNYIELEINSLTPEIKKNSLIAKRTNIRFFNHAFLNIFGDNFSFCTDPWSIGPAFNTGWWLKNATNKNWLKTINKSNFIYISHNHPDHLHPLTLSKINKKIPIIVPNFKSDSTGKYMEELGFKNIFRLDFLTQYKLTQTDLIICIFKSGDFRDDSGLYFSNGNFTALLGVDSNLLNFERYPKVDLYANSFAGGASGYPLMFENYSLKEKLIIIRKNRLFEKNKLLNNLDKIKPKYFLPYAGFFDEKLKRDFEIKKYNEKNSIEDYQSFCDKKKIFLLDVIKNNLYTFKGSSLINSKIETESKSKDLIICEYLNYYKKEYKKIDENYIKNYFVNSDFKDNLKLYISLTNDNFKLQNKNYFIKFTKEKIFFNKIKKISNIKNKSTKEFRILYLKIRKESFLNTLYNKLPWEDLLIGFQCRVWRNPNTYNANFWYHFTNIYTHSKNVRSQTNCGSCEKISQFFDNNIIKLYQKN